MSKILEIKDLCFAYNENKEVLNSLSFSLESGTYNILLGPNGSGKSTIAKLIIGLLEANSGEIIFNGTKLTEDSLDEIRNHVAIVFQNPDNQFIGSTVEDDIAFGLENRCVETSKMQDIINEYASKVGMIDFLKKEPSNLSGGQKQRVAIAGALALKPDLLILDEATSMLDPKGKKEILEVIASIRKENPNMTILSITHHIDETLNADNIIIVNDGKVTKEGNSSLLYDKDLLESNRLKPPFVVEVSSKLGLDGVTSLEELVSKL